MSARAPAAPPGWNAREQAGAWLYARPGRFEALSSAGLDSLARWIEVLATAGRGPGRGAVARVDIPGIGGAILKKMKRGGLPARLLGDRFLGSRRLLANLVIPEHVGGRGVATPGSVAMFLRPGGLGRFEAWLAVEVVDGGRDLLSLLRRGPAPPGSIEAAVALVRRMHDAGIHHRDLNLGNLLVRRSAGDAWEAFVVDLDRAVLHARPVGLGTRRRALRRLERSYVKSFGELPATHAWHEVYAGGDAALARRLDAWRLTGRLRIAVHRWRWRLLRRP